jgi:type I restriction enzyme S subunit
LTDQKDLSDYDSDAQDNENIDEQAQKFARRFYPSLPEEWRFAKLDEECEKFIDYRGSTPPKADDGIHMISAANVKDGFILPERKEKFVSEETYDEWTTKGIPQKNDVIVTTEAPVGEVGIIRTDETLLPAQRLITMRTGDNIDSRYLKFCLQYERTQKQLDSYASGTTVSSFNQTDLRNSVIPLPPLPEQEKIGEILYNIEQKVIINSRIDDLLEEISRLLYESWFVDFKPYGEFKESELGKIPVEFNVEEMGDLVWSGRGYSYTSDYLDKENEEEDSYPMVNLGNVKEGGGFQFDNLKYYTEDEIKERYKVDKGDLIVAITDLTQEGRVVGSPVLVPYFETDKVIISQDVAKIEPDKIPKIFLYYVMATDNFKKYCESHATGTTVLHLSLKSINAYKFPLPPDSEIERFTKTVEGMRSFINKNRQESSDLIDLRDTLLPKLMSGEIRLDPDSNNEPTVND